MNAQPTIALATAINVIESYLNAGSLFIEGLRLMTRFSKERTDNKKHEFVLDSKRLHAIDLCMEALVSAGHTLKYGKFQYKCNKLIPVTWEDQFEAQSIELLPIVDAMEDLLASLEM